MLAVGAWISIDDHYISLVDDAIDRRSNKCINL